MTSDTTAATPPLSDPARPRQNVWVAYAALALTLLVYGPILGHMVRHWYIVEDYSHGFLIVPLSLWFAWERRRRLRRAPVEPSWLGLVPLALGTLTLMVGRLGVELMNMRVSFVFTVIGLVLLVLGRRVFRSSPSPCSSCS